MLGLRLAPGVAPDDGFTELFQTHVGRELTITRDGSSGLLLRGVRCDRATMLVEARNKPIDDSGPLDFALLLDCERVEPLREPAWTHRVEVAGNPARWLADACPEPRHPIEARLIQELDEDPNTMASPTWSVFGDYLLDLGDPDAEALATRHGPSDPKSRVLWEASGGEGRVGRRWEFDGLEWAPKVWGTWVGPFLTRLAIAPTWLRVGGGPHVVDNASVERWPEEVGLETEPPFRRPGLSVAEGNELGIASWNETPGFDAWPELRAMLRLPCCRLLSPTRIILAGGDPPSLELAGADLGGMDLRGIVLAQPNLVGARARGVNLRGAELRDALLQGADLRDADLRDSAVWGYLAGVDLRGADLRNANFSHARIEDAKIDGARLDGLGVHAMRMDAWVELGAPRDRLLETGSVGRLPGRVEFTRR